jgi:hypothetical protein
MGFGGEQMAPEHVELSESVTARPVAHLGPVTLCAPARAAGQLTMPRSVSHSATSQRTHRMPRSGPSLRGTA